MSALSKEQSTPAPRPVALSQGWNAYTPSHEGVGRVDFDGSDTTMDYRIALNQAETLIRAQEDRIRNLEESALTDELTGLANRRGFSAAFKRELAMARRDADYDGVLVMIDLKGFQSIIKMWGQKTGEATLRAVAETLRNGTRANDTVARLEGDKFALLLTHMDEVTGVKRLAKLEKAFGRKMTMPEGSPLRANFGFAAYTGTSSANAVIQTAELRLYAHKSSHK
ncbi:MAG: GGDEF domain-containing protein [Bdellovibrionales bacterium]